MICMVILLRDNLFFNGDSLITASVRSRGVSRKIKLVEETCQNVSLSRACKTELDMHAEKFYSVRQCTKHLLRIYFGHERLKSIKRIMR